jgi:hypothetical protein
MTGLFDSRSDLAKVVRGLPPELGERLTFHLPLEVQALEVAGASNDQIVARIEQRLPAAFSAALIDPPFFRWAEEHYRAEGEGLLSSDLEQRRRAFAAVAALGPGLAGAAFHALIRTGYGALRRDPHEVTRGLAYLRARRQILFAIPPTDAPASQATLPTAEDLEGTSVFDQLDLVAGERSLYSTDPSPSVLPNVGDLARSAFDLVLRDPSSFIAIHTVTGLHALVELDRLVTARGDLGGVPSDPLLIPWWQAMANAIKACSVLVEASSPPPPTRALIDYRSMEALVDASIDSCEVHDLKLSVSLSRLVELGVVPAVDALVVGSAKLAATECSA